MERGRDDEKQMSAVTRTISILEALSRTDGINLENLARTTELPKATLLRFLSSLTSLGYVYRDGADMYHLTLKMFSVGSRSLKHIDLINTAKPFAKELCQTLGETVHMGILEDWNAVYVLKEESSYTLRMYSRVGKVIPLYCTAIGKIFLSEMPENTLKDYFKANPLKPFTPKSIRTEDAMMEELEREYARIEGCIANGVASLSDLDLIEVERITQNQSRDRLSSMLDAYLRVLTLMTGVRISDAAQLVMPVPEDSDKEQMLNALIASEIRRPELELYKAQELEIDTQLDYWTAGGLPQFSLFIRGGYGRPGLNMLDDSFQPFAIGGIRLVWNISQLYSLGYGKKIVNYSKEQVNSVRETFLFNTNLQVQEQVAEIQRYFKTVEDDERIVELREKIRESTAAGVENGTKNASDLVSEINKENAARKQLIMHQIEMMKAMYELKTIKNS